MRIGPKMLQVVEYVKRNPGCSKAPAARYAFHREHGWRKFGYPIVNRAIAAGLVVATRQSSGVYSLRLAM